MKGRAYVFINTLQAARCGHVGWGFAVDAAADRFFFGSTDHLFRERWWDLAAWLRYAHVGPYADNDWWCATGTEAEMLQVMSRGTPDKYHIRYHRCKWFEVHQADPEPAVSAANKLRDNGWSLLVNNCVHQTHHVLSQYGAKLPSPHSSLLSIVPMRWFEAIDGELLKF